MLLTPDNSFYRRKLSCGTLQVISEYSASQLSALFDIAERRNPKRAFLFVSKVLGRHIPVSPTVMRQIYQRLAEQFPDNTEGPVLFIGMAETAVGLGAGIFDALRLRLSESVYLCSTRHPVDGELLCEFQEAHSHATDHLLYLPQEPEMRRRVVEARTLVLIDDEATTGNTFFNLLKALADSGALPLLRRVVTVTLTDWSDGAFSLRCPLPVQEISLVSGQWQWFPDADAPVPTMPAVNVTTRATVSIAGRQSWGRLGMTQPDDCLGCDITITGGEKVLVLGTSEFVWQPFLLAERLEALGAKVLFGATTRSPIAQGLAIESVIGFTDNYGLGIANYVYNVAHQRFDRILLCSETPAESIDSALLTALAEVAPVVEIVTYE